MNSDGKMQSSTDQGPVNQIVPSASIAQCSDSGTTASVASSATLWNSDSLYDTDAPTPTANVVSPAQENVAGSEALVSSSSQGLVPHQLHGVSVHGNSGQRQQQQRQSQHQQEQQHFRHQNQQMIQSDLYTQSSNLGPG